MVETASFSYEGNAVMYLKGNQQDFPKKIFSDNPILIEKIDHLIPIQVTCKVRDSTLSLSAKIDYSTKKVSLDESTKKMLGELSVSEDRFKNSIWKFLEVEGENAALDLMENDVFAEDERESIAREIRSVKESFLAQDLDFGKDRVMGKIKGENE